MVNNLVNTPELRYAFFLFLFLENMDRLLRLGGGMPGLGQVSTQHVSILMLIPNIRKLVLVTSICFPSTIKFFSNIVHLLQFCRVALLLFCGFD